MGEFLLSIDVYIYIKELSGHLFVNWLEFGKIINERKDKSMLFTLVMLICLPGHMRIDENNCNTCTAGKYTDVNDMPYCLDCPPGRFSGEGFSQCQNCTTGYGSSVGSSACQPCGPGSYANRECVACPTGKASINASNNECAPCSNISFAENTGATTCVECPVSTMATTTRAGCEACPEYYYRNEGDVSCRWCGELYPLNGSMIIEQNDIVSACWGWIVEANISDKISSEGFVPTRILIKEFEKSLEPNTGKTILFLLLNVGLILTTSLFFYSQNHEFHLLQAIQFYKNDAS